MKRLWTLFVPGGLLGAALLMLTTWTARAQQDPDAAQNPLRGMIEERFKMMDTNGDGSITEGEPGWEMVQRADADGDGKVSMDELTQGAMTMIRRQAGNGGGTPEERFKQADKNGDGSLTADELPNPAIFKALDANGDGKVTAEEGKAFAENVRASMGGRGLAPNAPAASPTQPAAPRMNATGGTIRQELNVPYAAIPGVEPNLTSLDIYAPQNAKNAPVMVFVHGGGWRAGDKGNTNAMPVFFTQEGYVFVTVNYRLSPAVKHPAHVQDVAAALAWVKDNIASRGGDPGAIFLMGHSAGAHLVELVATNEKFLKEKGKELKLLKGVVVLDNPVTTEESLRLTAGNGNAMMTAAFGTDPAGWKDAAPLEHLARDKGIPPMMIVTASRVGGELGAVEQAAKIMREKAGVRTEVVDARSFKNHATINQEFGLPGDPPTQAVLEFLKSLRPGTPAVASLGGTKVLEAPKTTAGLAPAEPAPAQAASTTPATNAAAGDRQARIEQLRGQLTAADANGDGKLSKDEAPEWMKPRFERIDTDGDGQVTADEIRTAFEAMRARRAAQQAGAQPQ